MHRKGFKHELLVDQNKKEIAIVELKLNPDFTMHFKETMNGFFAQRQRKRAAEPFQCDLALFFWCSHAKMHQSYALGHCVSCFSGLVK